MQNLTGIIIIHFSFCPKGGSVDQSNKAAEGAAQLQFGSELVVSKSISLLNEYNSKDYSFFLFISLQY